MNKALFLSAAGCCFLIAAAANAQVDFQLNVGRPAYPAYVAPPPPPPAVYVSPYPRAHDPWHRRRDWEYWDKVHHHEHR